MFYKFFLLFNKFCLKKDNEFANQRNKIKIQKVKHLGDGLSQAGNSLIIGFENGVKGK